MNAQIETLADGMDTYDRLTLNFEKLGAILYNLSDHEGIYKMPKRESAVFLSMGIEIFEAAKDDARELYKEVTNHEPQEETEGNSKDIFDYIHDETNKIYTDFLMIWEKAKEIEKLENADDSADCSLQIYFPPRRLKLIKIGFVDLMMSRMDGYQIDRLIKNNDEFNVVPLILPPVEIL